MAAGHGPATTWRLGLVSSPQSSLQTVRMWAYSGWMAKENGWMAPMTKGLRWS